MEVDEQKVKKILMEELGYSGVGAAMTLLAISRAHEGIHDALRQWIEDRTEVAMTFMGITIEDIRDKKGRDYLNSLLTMSAHMKDPELVELFLKVPKSRMQRRCRGLRLK